VKDLEKKEFSSKKRKELASKGNAMPDGSFPIENVGDLKNAIQSIGRAKDYAKTKSHIIRRARALNAVKELPEDWNIKKFFEDVKDLIEKAIGTSSSIDQERDERSVENYVRAGGDIIMNTTEPDPQGEIAVQKSFPQAGSEHLIAQETRPVNGATSVSDAPNGDSAVVPENATFDSSATSAIAPSSQGEMQNADKVSITKSTTCPDCGASMMHECYMDKADGADDADSASEPDDDEDDKDLKKQIKKLKKLKKQIENIEQKQNEMQKSIWGGAFAPTKL
jgi:hypothetical protein